MLRTKIQLVNVQILIIFIKSLIVLRIWKVKFASPHEDSVVFVKLKFRRPHILEYFFICFIKFCLVETKKVW